MRPCASPAGGGSRQLARPSPVQRPYPSPAEFPSSPSQRSRLSTPTSSASPASPRRLSAPRAPKPRPAAAPELQHGGRSGLYVWVLRPRHPGHCSSGCSLYVPHGLQRTTGSRMHSSGAWLLGPLGQRDDVIAKPHCIHCATVYPPPPPRCCCCCCCWARYCRSLQLSPE